MSLLFFFFILVLYLYEMRNCNSDCKDLKFDCLLIKQSIKLASEIQYRLIELGKNFIYVFPGHDFDNGCVRKGVLVAKQSFGF